MASGCILGICWVCDEFVWEDDDWCFKDNFIHQDCRDKAMEIRKLTPAAEVAEFIRKLDELKQHINKQILNCGLDLIGLAKEMGSEKDN